MKKYYILAVFYVAIFFVFYALFPEYGTLNCSDTTIDLESGIAPTGDDIQWSNDPLKYYLHEDYFDDLTIIRKDGSELVISHDKIMKFFEQLANE